MTNILLVGVGGAAGSILRYLAGRGLVAAADQWMHAQDIANPARMTAMLAPGFRG